MSMTRIVTKMMLLMLLSPIMGVAQPGVPEFSYKVTVDLVNVTPDKDRVKVTVVPPAVQGKEIRYILPQYLPGVAGKVDAGRFIHQFYALDDEGYPLKVKKKGNNVIVLKLRPGRIIKKIEYWIDDTWDDEKSKPKMSEEKFNYVPQSAGTNIDAGNCFVLNHAFIVGYFLGYAQVPYHFTILKPGEMFASTSLSVKHDLRSRDEYSVKSYRELIDNPVMYSIPDTAGFLSGNVYVTISVFSENGKITARLVRRLLAAQITSSTNFIPEIDYSEYKLMMYFTTPFKTVLNLHGAYGGNAHRNSAFYFMPELADEDALANELQRETRGDILHLLAPLDHSASCSTGDLLKPQLNKSWWFCQGTNLYFGWLSAVRDSFLSEGEFMGAVSAKIRNSTVVPRKPLTDLEMVQEMMNTPLTREGIRARAMITAFLFDIRLTEATGGKTGLREAVVYLDRQGPVKPDSLEQKLTEIGGAWVTEFFRDYVNGVKPLPLMEYLGKIGWAYAPSTIDSVLTFGQFGLLYDNDKDIFLVHNADTNNRFGLRDGDRIVSVDNQIISASNFEAALNSVYYPRKNAPVELRYIRDKQNFSVSAFPVIRSILVEHLIRWDAAAPEDAVLLHARIFISQEEVGSNH
jgi:predicted metalloprotease with PDZ domain